MAQPATEQIGYFVEFLQNYKGDFKLDDAIGLTERLARTLEEAVARTDSALHDEFKAIVAEIAALKRDIADFRPDAMRFDRIPEAGRELDAVVEATEEATQMIMECAEAVMADDGSDPVAFKALVDEKIMIIFEACAFQDITGQRIRKVVKTLDWIEQRIASLASKLRVTEAPAEEVETDDERRMRELLLHGPQMKGEGVSQDAVDGFFATSDQDDIDALFR
jgi:chemotaxis protein CheZ